MDLIMTIQRALQRECLTFRPTVSLAQTDWLRGGLVVTRRVSEEGQHRASLTRRVTGPVAPIARGRCNRLELRDFLNAFGCCRETDFGRRVIV
jgi:hypothetical protein